MRNIILIYLIILIAIVAPVCIVVYQMYPSGSYAYEIDIDLSVTNESGIYVVTVEKAKEGRGRDVWDFGAFSGTIWTVFPSTSSEDMLLRRSLGFLLNNETSNLTFYDVDGNGKLSVGDTFVIKGSFAEGGKYFVLRSELGGGDFPIKLGA